MGNVRRQGARDGGLTRLMSPRADAMIASRVLLAPLYCPLAVELPDSKPSVSGPSVAWRGFASMIQTLLLGSRAAKVGP